MSLNDAISKAKKLLGEESLVDMENFSLTCPALPTGVFVFDHITGIGGLPLGRFVELFGPESSGKSTLMLHACIGCQKILKRPVLYLDYEQGFDKSYAQKIGVDLSPDMFIMAQPGILEEGMKIAEIFVEEKSVGLVVVDSLAAMIPEALLFDKKGKKRDFSDTKPMGAQGKAMAEALQRLKEPVRVGNVCFCFINQIRIDLGAAQMGVKKFITPGSSTLKFYASMRVEFKFGGRVKGKVVSLESDDDESDGIIGLTTKVKIVKNKVAPPFGECQFTMVVDKGIDRVATVVNYAIGHGYISKSGGWFVLPSFKGVPSPNQRGLSAVRTYFEENPEKLIALENALKGDMSGKREEPEQSMPEDVLESINTEEKEFNVEGHENATDSDEARDGGNDASSDGN